MVFYRKIWGIVQRLSDTQLSPQSQSLKTGTAHQYSDSEQQNQIYSGACRAEWVLLFPLLALSRKHQLWDESRSLPYFGDVWLSAVLCPAHPQPVDFSANSGLKVKLATATVLVLVSHSLASELRGEGGWRSGCSGKRQSASQISWRCCVDLRYRCCLMGWCCSHLESGLLLFHLP